MILCQLTGCKNINEPLDRVIELRDSILTGNGCKFNTVISADYEDSVHVFKMDCQFDADGNMTFTVTEPDTIAGITGQISDDQAGITFDDYVLAFEQLSDGLISPVSSPWVFIKTLRSGYIRGCTVEGGQLEVMIDDTYETETLQLNILLDEYDFPRMAEIFWQGRRMVTLEINDFSCL